MKKILAILKTIGTLTGAGAVIISLTIAFNNSKHRQESIQSEQQSIRLDIKKIAVNDSMKTIMVNNLFEITKENKTVLNALRESYVNKSYDELKKDLLTTEEFINLMQGIGFEDIKKNLTNKDDMIASDK